jgi:hypothetical protein
MEKKSSQQENPSHRRGPLFVFSAGRNLKVQRSLLATLGLDEEYIRRCEGRRKLDVFLGEAQRAWESALGAVNYGNVNFILWLRRLLNEAHSIGVWIPRIFIRRLRELERGDLVVENEQGPIRLPPHAGLPEKFQECCKYLGWRWGIVPGLREGEYQSLREPGEDETGFVEAVCAAWKARPHDADVETTRRFVVEELDKAGWKVT